MFWDEEEKNDFCSSIPKAGNGQPIRGGGVLQFSYPSFTLYGPQGQWSQSPIIGNESFMKISNRYLEQSDSSSSTSASSCSDTPCLLPSLHAVREPALHSSFHLCSLYSYWLCLSMHRVPWVVQKLEVGRNLGQLGRCRWKPPYPRILPPGQGQLPNVSRGQHATSTVKNIQ